MERYLQSYRAENPSASVQDANFLRKDMAHLIKQKNRLFPQVKTPIMRAEIQESGDHFSIAAVSMRTE